QAWHSFRRFKSFPRNRVDCRFEELFELLLSEFSATMWAREIVSNPFGVIVQCFVQEVDLPSAMRAGEDLTPHRVLYPPFRFAVGMDRFVHPTTLVFQFFKQFLAGLGKGFDVDWNIVVGANEGGCGRKVIDDSTPSAAFRRWHCLLVPLPH